MTAIKTPLQQAIDKCNAKIRALGIGSAKLESLHTPESRTFISLEIRVWDEIKEHLQSLLPVEQQFNCELIEWVGTEQYRQVVDTKNEWMKTSGSYKSVTTTELLQLFTNKKDK